MGLFTDILISVKTLVNGSNQQSFWRRLRTTVICEPTVRSWVAQDCDKKHLRLQRNKFRCGSYLIAFFEPQNDPRVRAPFSRIRWKTLKLSKSSEILPRLESLPRKMFAKIRRARRRSKVEVGRLKTRKAGKPRSLFNACSKEPQKRR